MSAAGERRPADGPTLAEVQEWLRRLVTDPRGISEILRGGGTEAAPRIGGRPLEAVLRPVAGDEPGRRIEVYAAAYEARMMESLATTYPTVRRILGAPTFLAMSRRYVAARPSRHHDLSRVGDRLPAWLEGDELAGELPFLPDLAHLELAIQRVFHAHLEAPISAHALAALDAASLDGARLTLQPSLEMLRSAWPVKTLRDHRDVPDDEFRVEVEGHPESVVVHRVGLDVTVRTVDAAELACLEALRAGASLGEALEAAVGAAPAVEPGTRPDLGCASEGGEGALPELPVAAWFATWTAAGLIVAVG